MDDPHPRARSSWLALVDATTSLRFAAEVHVDVHLLGAGVARMNSSTAGPHHLDLWLWGEVNPESLDLVRRRWQEPHREAASRPDAYSRSLNSA